MAISETMRNCRAKTSAKVTMLVWAAAVIASVAPPARLKKNALRHHAANSRMTYFSKSIFSGNRFFSIGIPLFCSRRLIISKLILLLYPIFLYLSNSLFFDKKGAES